jgi:glycosyltransferase involved in cell wall biosynthesis
MLVFMIKILFLKIKEVGKPDYIIVSSMPIFPILSGYYFKKKYKAKLYFEIRDIWPLTLQLLGNKSSNHPAVRFIGWFEKFGYRKADVVVSLLPNAKHHFEKVAKRKINFSYIPNGIDENQLKKEYVDKSITDKIPKDKFIVGYAGTLGLANAMEFLIDASIKLKDNKDIFFVIVGDGYLKKELQQKTKGNMNIIFLDRIRKNQVQHMLSFFDVCFVGRNDTPLFKHGVSANKYFDYMLAKKPILDSNNFIKDPVELSGGGIIVKPDDAQAIINGIIKMQKMSSKERQNIGENGCNFVKEKHNIAYLSKKYIDLFETNSK